MRMPVLCLTYTRADNYLQVVAAAQPWERSPKPAELLGLRQVSMVKAVGEYINGNDRTGRLA